MAPTESQEYAVMNDHVEVFCRTSRQSTNQQTDDPGTVSANMDQLVSYNGTPSPVTCSCDQKKSASHMILKGIEVAVTTTVDNLNASAPHFWQD